MTDEHVCVASVNVAAGDATADVEVHVQETSTGDVVSVSLVKGAFRWMIAAVREKATPGSTSSTRVRVPHSAVPSVHRLPFTAPSDRAECRPLDGDGLPSDVPCEPSSRDQGTGRASGATPARNSRSPRELEIHPGRLFQTRRATPPTLPPPTRRLRPSPRRPTETPQSATQRCCEKECPRPRKLLRCSVDVLPQVGTIPPM
jgi:hypothetical protein